MRGLDLSHWNAVTDWKKVKNAGYEFIFIKCTEGTSYSDPSYIGKKGEIRDLGLVFGAYHFAKGTDPVKEADYFLSKIGDLRAGDCVILDYELYTLADPASWCLKWLKRVEEKLGFKPFLYTYHALLQKYNWRVVSNNNNGLWAARYGQQTQDPNPEFAPATGTWQFYAIWQYCSKGKVPGINGSVDLNTTDMDVATLKKYGKPPEHCNHLCPVHCDPQ